MRILHAPYNIAGQATMISRAQRELGYKSDILTFVRHNFLYDDDIFLDIDIKKGYLKSAYKLLVNFIKCLSRYDVFHFHFGNTLLPFNLDLPLLKLFKKKTVMEYWGSDAIQADIALKYTLFSKKDLERIYPNLNDDKKRRKIKRINRWVGKSIVGDYSLLPYSPESIVVRQAFDINKVGFVGCEPKKGKLKIIHAPSDRSIKGTRYLIRAVKELQKSGEKIELIIVENKPNKTALEIFKKADIIVDDLLQGPYGIFAMECMAIGKPVVCRRDNKFNKYYPDLPIINANPDNIAPKLKYLIDHPKLRQQLGRRGRKYVEKNHDAKKIANKLIEIYKKI